MPAAIFQSGTNTVVSLTATGAGQLAARIDTTTGATGRGFFLEDALQFSPMPGSTPLNVFTNGVRDFRREACWGAMLEPYPWGIVPSGTMRAVRATVAVFRKPGDVRRMTLTGSAGGVFVITAGDGLSDDAERKRFVPPCAAVLAVAKTGTAAPQWLTINSSWPQWAAGAVRQAVPPASYGVVFRERGSAYASLVSGSSLQLIGFEGIQGIAQQVYTID